MIEGTWSVRLTDGTVMSQFDLDHPSFTTSEGHPHGGEVPFRAIRWPDVTELTLESAEARSTFDIVPPGPGYYLGLRSRTYVIQSWVKGPMTYHESDPGDNWKKDQDALGRAVWFQWLPSNLQARAFMVCTMREDVEIDLDRAETAAAATVHVTYWLPDGTIHDCHLYDCPDVANWLQAIAKKDSVGRMPASHASALGAGAAIAPTTMEIPCDD